MSQIRGRFRKPAAKMASAYTQSLSFDRRLYKYDIEGSTAHARMLAKQGIISGEDASQIVKGLEDVRAEIEQGRFEFKAELEDIHMAIEARLIEKVGEAGRKLHTARSRNDQVALDIRLYAKDAIRATAEKIAGLQRALVDLAQANKTVIMPGYTHLQVAQPVLFAHHMLAYFEMLGRDAERFAECFRRADVMPLGSGALAGVPYKIDRRLVAKELGFRRITANSIDAVADRDFLLEYEAAAGICMMHLSRLAEELVVWSSAEFDLVELDEGYTTGSSIMPQKKNPDVAELARAKTGRVYGHLLGLLTTMKGLPLAYDRDLQEDKEGFFDTVDTLQETLGVFTGMIGTLRVKPENMRRAAERGYILATDLADYLVKKGESFRRAHEAVGKLVSYASGTGKSLCQLDINEYRQYSALFGEDVYRITLESSLAARDVPGGTAPGRVDRALAAARKKLGDRAEFKRGT